MNFRQLVTRNVTRNGRAFASYYLSSLFSVMVFFIFALLYYHPSFSEGLTASSGMIAFLASIGMVLSQILIVLMSFIFLSYAFNVFLKSRKRDFSVYLVLGMSEKDLKKMVFLENIFLAFGAIISGILLGTLFSKVILLIAQNLLSLDQEMLFYFPLKPAMLTLVIYLILFLLMALVTTWRLKPNDLVSMTKSEEKALPEPRARWYLSLLSLLLLSLGYGAVCYFSMYLDALPGDPLVSGLALLVSGVLLTVAGTYIFFQQTSVGFFRFLKKSAFYFKNGQMLTISNLVYRMKNNATMYFMIAIVASVAFVSIGVTFALGGDEFGATQEVNYAFVYQDYTLTEAGEKKHQEKRQFIVDAIEAEGYDLISQDVVPLWINLDVANQLSYAAVIPASVYNEMAKFNHQKLLTPVDNQLIFFATTNQSVNDMKRQGKDKEVIQTNLYYLIEDGSEGTPGSYTYTTERFAIFYDDLAVVSDQTYQAILTAQDAANEEPQVRSHTYVYHFNEWPQARALNNKIIDYLTKEEKEFQRKSAEFHESIAGIEEDDLTDEQKAERDEVSDLYFNFSSLYKNWHDTKQANGMILLISVLIGSVFFTFAACIIYFRLFGELAKDGAYHRSLHILGVSQQLRHKIVTREMLLMYFVPIMLAIVHFAVAMFAFSFMVSLPILKYFTWVVVVFLIFQLVFFVISRWRYLHHLDYIAEKN